VEGCRWEGQNLQLKEVQSLKKKKKEEEKEKEKEEEEEEDEEEKEKKKKKKKKAFHRTSFCITSIVLDENWFKDQLAQSRSSQRYCGKSLLEGCPKIGLLLNNRTSRKNNNA